MILLLMQSPLASECKEELERRAGQLVTLCSTVREGVSVMQGGRYEALVLDQNVLDSNPGQAGTLARCSSMAVTVVINPGTWGMDRLCKEIGFALERAKREKFIAKELARNELNEQLSGAVTGILLSSELALREDSLPPSVEEKLRSMRDLALHMSTCLRQNATDANSSGGQRV
ncbi:MAG TPA: hypothetical protein VKZ53_03620 [Candidatus Angelobacter sp.]|nr:hypothetical protein [Candidatus Angelobacter sp.]